jgi:LAO/AO transport system kinase
MSQAAPIHAPVDDLIRRLLDGDRAALARALTAVENDTPAAPSIARAIYPHLGRARTVGVTGAPGAGKSTLVSALIGELRGQGKSVGVIAVDPSSPITGGAILGDRIRMADHDRDDSVFVRSLSSRGHLGGLSRAAARAVDVMDAAGRDFIIVETVGTGQAEVEIADIAGTRIVVLAPGLGDDVQAIKSGVLEIADIFVVNKSDLAQADHTVRHLTGMIQLRGHHDGWRIPVLTTTATTGAGIKDLAEAIEQYAAFCTGRDKTSATERAHRLLASIAATTARDELARLESAELDAILEGVVRGDLSYGAASRLALALLGRRLSGG